MQEKESFVLPLLDLCRAAGWSRRWRWTNLIWVAAIVWSTVAVRQHVVLDVVGGMALGLAFAWLSLRTRAPELADA